MRALTGAPAVCRKIAAELRLVARRGPPPRRRRPVVEEDARFAGCIVRAAARFLLAAAHFKGRDEFRPSRRGCNASHLCRSLC
jgi:hypothetical protein